MLVQFKISQRDGVKLDVLKGWANSEITRGWGKIVLHKRKEVEPISGKSVMSEKMEHPSFLQVLHHIKLEKFQDKGHK